MNWFQQNRFLRTFLVALVLATLVSLWFLFHEKGAADAAQVQLAETVNELNRLRRSTPFPGLDNLKKTKVQTESYRASLAALEKELNGWMFPPLPLQPNEFQAQLRLAVNDVVDHAATAKVQLPPNFNLGFDAYATSLPNLDAAPPLGRQLRAIEWIANTVIDAHIDALGSLTREPLPDENSAPGSTPSPARTASQTKPAAGKDKIVDSAAIELTFSGSPASVRRVINQIAAAREQFYIIRTLVVKNQVNTGPKRSGSEPGAPAPSPAAGGEEPAIRFIVGTEHLDAAARIEIVRFSFPQKEGR